MPVQKSAGAVIFRKGRGKNFYLLLNYAAIGKVEKTYWGFSKGTIEKGEKEMDTIIREIKEETGIKDLKFVKGFKAAWRNTFLEAKKKQFLKQFIIY